MIIKVRKKKIVFYHAFIIWFLSDILSSSTLSESTGIDFLFINGVVDYFVLIILVLYIFFSQKYQSSEMITILIVTAPIVISAIMCRNLRMLSLLVFLVAAKDIDVYRVVRDVYYVLLFSISSLAFLSMNGIIRDFAYYRKGVLRHSLGFLHPNSLGMEVFLLIVCYVILHENQLFKQMLAIIFGTIFNYKVPNSQSPVILLVILGVMLLLHSIWKRKNMKDDKFQKLLILTSGMINVTCVILAIFDFSKTGIYSLLNKVMSSRFYFSRLAFEESGAKLFGQVVYTSIQQRRRIGLDGYLFLDNAYTTLFIRYGIIVYVILSVAYLMLMNVQRIKGRELVVIILFVYSVYGIMESSMFMLRYNVLLFYLTEVIFAPIHSYYADKRIQNRQECI